MLVPIHWQTCWFRGKYKFVSFDKIDKYLGKQFLLKTFEFCLQFKWDKRLQDIENSEVNHILLESDLIKKRWKKPVWIFANSYGMGHVNLIWYGISMNVSQTSQVSRACLLVLDLSRKIYSRSGVLLHP